MKRKLVPSFIMLLAGAVTSITMFLNHYEIKQMLWILVGVLVSFYIMGVIIKKILDSFEKKAKEENSNLDEGKVIEKDISDKNSEEEKNELKDEQ